MAIFQYTVLDNQNNRLTGELEAKDQDNLAMFLHQKGYRILNITEKVDYFEEIFASGVPKVKLKERVILAKQLATMLGAGLPITQALEIIVQQTKDKAFKKNVHSVLEDIQKNGIPLSDAFEKNTKIFNNVQLNLIRAGEASGNLYEVLVKVAQDLEKSKNLQSKIKGAMIYPSIIFVVIGIVLAIMMIYMIPAVQGLYEDFGIGPERMPAVTRFLIALSNFMTNPLGLTITLVLSISFYLGFKYYKSTEGGKSVLHKLVLKLPVVGNLVSMIQVAEFSRILSMLIKSGVPIIKALEIVADALSNVHYQKVIVEALADVSNGIPLAVPLSRSEVYPPLIVRMVAIGEETGKLDSVLSDMAKFYDDEVEEISSNLNKLMEPMILLVVGGLVAFLAVGIYLPIYSIGANI